MDFLEEEAEVEEESSLSSEGEKVVESGEDDSDAVEGRKKKKVKKKKKQRIIDDDDSDEEEDEDEDDAQIQEEMKDFIKDDVEEEAEEESGDEGGKRKHEDSDIDDRLEDEDYDLIEENLGIKVKRKPKHKRIRVLSEDEDSDRGEEEGDKGREAVAEQLGFDSDVGEGEEPSQPAETDYQNLVESEEEEDEMAGFIVDEDGEPIHGQRKKKKHIIHSDSALQEAQEIFGVDFDPGEFEDFGPEEEEDFEDEYADEDDEDMEGKRKKDRRKKRSKMGIYDVYEPTELERGFFTDKDQEIRSADIPERFQLRQIPVKPTEEGELEEEAEWIYKQAFVTTTVTQQGFMEQDNHGRNHSTVNKIREAINFMRNQQFEVPFIAFYRKEYVEPDLHINDLWKVWHWDEKWTQLRSRKENLIVLFEKMQNYQFDMNSDPDQVLASNVRPLTDEDVDRVRQVQTLEELRDVYQHFLLYYGTDLPKMRNAEKKKAKETSESQEGEEQEKKDDDIHDSMKQASRKNGYTICTRNKLDEIAMKFGLTPEQFGENIRDNYQRNEVEQFPIEPLELAKDFISNQFPTEEDVMLGARHMVAMQIAHDPLVRQSVRQTYFERAKIKVTPTRKGIKEIDEEKPTYSMKYLKNKPIRDLKDDQFLKLTQAEDDNLLTIEMYIDEQVEGRQTYFEEIRQLYYRDEFSHLVQQWNSQRSEALERALTKILYPQMEKELRAKMLAESKEGIVKACCRKLYNWLKVAPYQADQQLYEDNDYDEKDGIRVLGIGFSTDHDRDVDTASFGALIDGEGQVTDFIKLVSLIKSNRAWRAVDREGKANDLKRLKEFIADKKPHVVAVTAESRDALSIIEDIKKIIDDLCQEQAIAPINVELVDNEVAMIYENSNKGKSDFREYPVVLRHAVLHSQTFTGPFDRDCVTKDELQNALTLEFVNRVNEVGVDVNRALDYPHTSLLLQFVCGLGPRKGSNLLRILKQTNQKLENRTQLVTHCHIGPKVFINCAGFIKIDTLKFSDSTDSYIEVLDGSRVHPETYEWARKMAVDALEYDDTAEGANPAGALEEILESPERLKDLDLDAFAEELERQGYGDKHITLYDTRAELNHRYKDLRTPYRSPLNEEIFNMITKETPETFYVGKLVLARVAGIAYRRPRGEQLDQANPVRDEETGLWQCPFCNRNDFPELSEVWSHFDAGSCPGSAVGVKCRLDNSVNGFVHTKNISDKKVKNPADRVQIGMTIHCRITKIDIDRFQVDMTCKSSDLLDKENQWRPQKDLYYDADRETADKTKEETKKKQQARQSYVKRVIAHPSFHNIGYKECEKILANMDQGEAIIRPSSKGADHLTVSWKIADDIIQHIDIKEEGKENAFSLGSSLWIGGEEFEDLDEILARFIQPMAAYARDILNFKYYRMAENGKRELLDKVLHEEKKKAPSKIPYFCSLSKQYPGKFLVSYMPRTKPRHEYATLSSEGIRYRNQMFHSLNSMMRWFKEHFRDPIPGTPASRTPGMASSTYATPSINLQGVDAATIQRAAAGLPNNIYNTLAQVAGATPRVATPRVARMTPGATPQQFPPVAGFSGGFVRLYN
ncbi:transcription elongation factor SPT6 [Mytilus galloprovincialis]|uniref:Transcription elongation factor SPT6 n=1 Tax=Mytilus galloprovincialis TaxID=29158 RepID=A0A8B6C585_MYTGA|nr:transcription elongation factor SPT6 [Mytilus galloprovincialis]